MRSSAPSSGRSTTSTAGRRSARLPYVDHRAQRPPVERDDGAAEEIGDEDLAAFQRLQVALGDLDLGSGQGFGRADRIHPPELENESVSQGRQGLDRVFPGFPAKLQKNLTTGSSQFVRPSVLLPEYWPGD